MTPCISTQSWGIVVSRVVKRWPLDQWLWSPFVCGCGLSSGRRVRETAARMMRSCRCASWSRRSVWIWCADPWRRSGRWHLLGRPVHISNFAFQDTNSEFHYHLPRTELVCHCLERQIGGVTARQIPEPNKRNTTRLIWHEQIDFLFDRL